MITGLDEVDWAGLRHAYGYAGDLPSLFRALIGADEKRAGDALEEIISAVHHQHTVFPATVPSVRFLAQAVELPGPVRRRLTVALGCLADPDQLSGELVEQVRAAVTAEGDCLLRLLADTDPEVRTAAAYTVTQAVGAAAVPSLRDRWAQEKTAEARASLAMALGACDPAATPLLLAAFHQEPSAVRAAVALALARRGDDLPDDVVGSLVELFSSEPEIKSFWAWVSDDVAIELAGTLPPARVVELISGLAVEAEPLARQEALSMAGKLCERSRSAASGLTAVLASLLSDPDDEVFRTAVHTVADLGQAAAPFSDRLCEIAADRSRSGTTVVGPDTFAIRTLILLKDPRWVALACDLLADGRELNLMFRDPPFHPEVLAAARRTLTDMVRRAPREPAVGPVIGWLAIGIGLWGRAAASADRELLTARRYADDDVDRARVMIGAVPVDTPPRRAPTVDDLRPLLTGQAARSHDERRIQVRAAGHMWRLTGKAKHVVPTLSAILAGGGLEASQATGLAADIGDRRLMGPLRALLDDRWAAVGAARALWRLGVPPGDLGPALLRQVATRGAMDAVALLAEMGATEAVPELRRLTEQDDRIVRDAWEDDQLRDAIRGTVASLTS
jgi:HEAT repeat protein